MLVRRGCPFRVRVPLCDMYSASQGDLYAGAAITMTATEFDQFLLVSQSTSGRAASKTCPEDQVV